MRTVRLGRTGVRVPAVGFGTWAHGGANVARGMEVGWTGDAARIGAEATAALLRGWELGLTHWDTADVYGEGAAERLIGGLWGQVPRDAIFLATKVGYDAGPYPHPYHPDFLDRRLERSLALLRTDRIDLYYFHHCDFGPDDAWLEPALARFHRYRREGKVRFLGLSDWDLGKVARLAPRIDPDVVQVVRNLADDDWQASGLAAWAAASDAGTAFFSPLKHGLLLGKYDRPTDFPEGDFRNNVEGFRDPAAIARYAAARRAVHERFPDHPQPVLHAVADALLTDAPEATVLLGLRRPDQVDAAATLGDPLSAEDAAWVRQLYGGTSP